jgi:NADPH:quinone reductase-like Zn-dependent oxidoreductase
VVTESGLLGPLKLLKAVGGMPLFNPVSLMNDNRGVFGVNMGHMWHETQKIRGWMEKLLEGVRDGWVRPHVDRSWPLAQAGEAQAYIESRGNIGKIVLTC